MAFSLLIPLSHGRGDKKRSFQYGKRCQGARNGKKQFGVYIYVVCEASGASRAHGKRLRPPKPYIYIYMF